MKDRTKTFVSVVSLILYGTLAIVSVPLHFHQDIHHSGGSGVHAFAQHDDALHCEHHAIESQADCTACSIGTYAAHYRVIAVIPQLNISLGHHTAGGFFEDGFTSCSAHSRRGPPFLPV